MRNEWTVSIVLQSQWHWQLFIRRAQFALETLSDSMVSLILLSIGGGWTLPSDVVRLGLGSSGSGGGGGLDGTTTLLVCYLTWSRIAAVAVALWT